MVVGNKLLYYSTHIPVADQIYVMTISHRKRAERFCRAPSAVLDGTTPSLSLQAAKAICGEFQLKQR